jgi:hypothetical protein
MKDLNFFTRRIISDDLGIDVPKHYHADKVKEEIEKYYSEKTIEDVQREITKIELSPINFFDYIINWGYFVGQFFIASLAIMLAFISGSGNIKMISSFWIENNEGLVETIVFFIVISALLVVVHNQRKYREKYYEYKLKCLYEILDNKKKNENVKNVKVRTLRNRRINIR